MRIFVSIASYRDPQLIPTIQDCLAKACYPDRLRFGICWQHGPEEPGPDRSDSRFRVLDVDWRASRGVCWARAQIMRLWDGEEFFLQLDSHHRFVPWWDFKLLHHAEESGSCKPILSAYAPSFTPGEPDVFGTEPLQMNFERFTEEAIALCRSQPIPQWGTLRRPVRARFLSGHFLFTIGDFVREVPYDPELYFTGEETDLAIRAYTRGYDFFHPSEIILWHEYIRGSQIRHWHDHLPDRSVGRPWYELDAVSRGKLERFLAAPHVGEFGCGTARTFADYEAYVGISFRHRKAQDYTRFGYEPPNPPASPDWVEHVRAYRLQISLDRAALPAAAWRDPHFWYLAFHDVKEREIYRQDVSEQELRQILASGSAFISIAREFESGVEPASWTIWPVSRSEGWLERLRGAVDRNCVLVA